MLPTDDDKVPAATLAEMLAQIRREGLAADNKLRASESGPASTSHESSGVLPNT